MHCMLPSWDLMVHFPHIALDKMSHSVSTLKIEILELNPTELYWLNQMRLFNTNIWLFVPVYLRRIWGLNTFQWGVQGDSDISLDTVTKLSAHKCATKFFANTRYQTKAKDAIALSSWKLYLHHLRAEGRKKGYLVAWSGKGCLLTLCVCSCLINK